MTGRVGRQALLTPYVPHGIEDKKGKYLTTDADNYLFGVVINRRWWTRRAHLMSVLGGVVVFMTTVTTSLPSILVVCNLKRLTGVEEIRL